MWSTIANFRENLSQIASDVLDTAEELEIGGSEHGAVDGLDDLLQRRRQQDLELQAEEHRFKTGISRLQQVESNMSMNQALLLKEKEEELLRLREENAILKKKVLTSAAERGPLSNGDIKRPHRLPESSEGHNNALHDWHGKETDGHDAGNIQGPSISRLKDLELQIRRLQTTEKDLTSEISQKNLAYASLKDAHTESLAEIRTLKEVLENERADVANANLQLQRERKTAEAAERESRRLKMAKQKMSMEIAELRRRLDEQMAEKDSARDHVRAEILKEMEPSLVVKDEKLEQLQKAVNRFEKENHELQEEVKRLMQRHSQSLTREDKQVHRLPDGQEIGVRDSVKQAADRLREAENAFELKSKDYENMLGAIRTERDKALRDLKRLKQHLLEKEEAESEKMDQDSEHISELEARASASTARALQLEQTLSQTLANQTEVNKKSNEALRKANEEIAHLKQKLSSCISALESKDVELLNLQTALGQYYAESEAKERLHGELVAARKEISLLSENLKVAHRAIELKNKEKEGVLEQLAFQEKRVLESQQKTQKAEEDVLMLRRALEQSITRLNRMSSDSDYYVDRRIVIKLLVTYFQRHHSKEVLDLMARMLGFSEEDKQAVGVAQEGGGRGVVRGVLGLPGRVVGGLLKSGSSGSSPPSLATENQSFSDLWIDFLLKESEERERREAGTAVSKTDGDKHSISSSHSTERTQESGTLYYNNAYGRGNDTSFRTNFTTEMAGSADKTFSTSELGDAAGSEFSTVPLNSASSPSPVSSFRHSRTPRP